MRPALTTVRVVIPARNEEESLPSTLASVERAVAELRARHSGMSVSVTVVLDACTDRTAAVVEGQPDLTTVAVAFACVGASRAAGVRAASVGDDPVRTWIANTDADTLVPADWLVVQVELADAGADVVTGTVEPDATGLTPDLLSRWWARHTLAEGHPHVHGANLGVRLHAYESAGGFTAMDAHEDVDLLGRLVAGGHAHVATARIHAVTSARLQGRAPEGFAHYLGELATASEAD